MSLLDDFKYKLAQNNAVVRIITLNVIIYLVFALAHVFFWLFKANDIISSVERLFVLYAGPINFIHQPWGIITYMFFHNGFFHILFNMLWLYWFGILLHEYLGNTRVYQIYFVGGIFGGLFYMLSYNVFPVFSENINYSSALGASAGVIAIVVATATLLPNYTVMLFGIFPVQLQYIALFSFLIDLLNIPSSNAGGRIAHIGGALAGFLFVKYLYSNNAFTNFIHSISSFFKGLFKQKPVMKVHHKSDTKVNFSNRANKPNQADIDAILDKISKSGYESLSPKEKELLFKASEE